MLGEPVGTVRRMCEQGFLGAWRVVDPSGSSARLRWHIPSDEVMPLLRTECGRRRLNELMAGKDSPWPRSTRRESPTNQGAIPAPIVLVSSDRSSDNSTDERSDTVLSQDRVVKKHFMIDNVSEEAP